ncbi:MAG: B12-binding domain-containing radical SAM protein [Candidatus Sumerlaeia bacterium]|nr:B12-binding domain-containing radical SAM protein [Candidatus Sumerlaeia bacterium]
MSMHVAFITAYDPESPYQVSLPPLGIGYLSAYAKQQCWFVQTSFHHTVEELIAAKPDIIAVSATTENFSHATALARAAKESLGVPVILGGMHITSLPTNLPDVYDLGVIGEGEQTLVDILNMYNDCPKAGPAEFRKLKGVSYHEDGRVAMTPSQDLIKVMDDLPYPDRDLIDHGWKVPSWETVHLVSSRGCPYKCSFCSSGLHWKRFRFFSPEYVAREIEYLRERYNPETLYFFDDLFVGHVGRWREVVKLFRERKIHEGVRFRAYARVDLITEQMAEEFAELNFKYIDFGFESNSEKILKFLTKTRVTPEINQRAMDYMAKNNLSVGANFIIGSPPETIEDMQESFDFANHNRNTIDRCSVGPLQPLPGTGVWNYAKLAGLVNEEDFEWARLGVSYDTFKWDRFPFMGEKVTREQFWDFWTKFHNLAKEINYVGQIRGIAHQRDMRALRVQELERELQSLKGSRVIRLAEKIRNLRQSISGNSKDVVGKAASF